MASPAFVASSLLTWPGGDTEVASVDATIPAHDSGDILVMAVSSSTSGTTPAVALDTPSGWTLAISAEGGGGSAVRMTVFFKVGTGSTTAVTVSISSGLMKAMTITCAYSGASGSLDATPASNVQDTGVDIDSPSITSTVADTTVIFAMVWDGPSADPATIDDDPAFQGTKREAAELNETNSTHLIAYSDVTLATATASGVCTWSSDGDSDGAAAVTLNIAPAAAGWTGKVNGVTNPDPIIGVDAANVAKVIGVA